MSFIPIMVIMNARHKSYSSLAVWHRYAGPPEIDLEQAAVRSKLGMSTVRTEWSREKPEYWTG